MVATLVKLRWRLTINSLRGVWWKILLEAWLFLNLFAFLAFAIGGLIALGMLGWRYTPQVLSVLVTLTVTGWLIFPLLITGVDNSLEPRQLRLWVVPSRKLAAGLIVAAGAGGPGIITGLVLLTTVITWLLHGSVAAAAFALVNMVLAWLTAVIGSRWLVTAAALSYRRRSRELATSLGILLIIGLAQIPNLIFSLHLDSSLSGWLKLARYSQYLPTAWAGAAPAQAASGNYLLASAFTVSSVLLVGGLYWLWQRSLNKAMTANVTTNDKGAGKNSELSKVFAAQESFAKFMPSPAATVCARSLRYLVRDFRLLLSFVTCIFMIVLFMVVFIGQAHRSGSVVMVYFAALMISITMGLTVSDDLATDSTAIHTSLLSGISGLHERLGRLVAMVIWQLPLVLVVSLIAPLLADQAKHLPVLLGLNLAVWGVVVGVAQVLAVVFPYQTNPPEASPFSAKGSGADALLASLAQMGSMLASMLLVTPTIALSVYCIVSENFQLAWLCVVLGVVNAVVVMVVGVRLGGKLLDRRWARLLFTISQWPGHTQS